MRTMTEVTLNPRSAMARGLLIHGIRWQVGIGHFKLGGDQSQNEKEKRYVWNPVLQ